MELKNSKVMRMIALQQRNKVCKTDFQELMEKIEKNAADGEFELCFVRNDNDKYPTLSAEDMDTLKSNGYKINLWYKQGWDNLHRYYKGALKVTWYK